MVLGTPLFSWYNHDCLLPFVPSTVWFFDKTPNKAVFAAIAVPGREEIRPAGREVYVHYPDGMGRFKLKLSSLGVATARNINTVAKLVEMTK